MSLIKNMLDDLDSRDKVEEKKIKKVSPPREPSQFAKVIKKPKFYLLSFVILVVLFAVVMFIKNAHHLTALKNSATQSYQKAQHSIVSMSPSTPAVKNKEATKKSPQTSTSLHRDYMAAVDDINEGKVQIAMKKLKVIIKEDPDFAPARHVYKNLVSRYGVK